MHDAIARPTYDRAAHKALLLTFVSQLPQGSAPWAVGEIHPQPSRHADQRRADREVGSWEPEKYQGCQRKKT